MFADFAYIRLLVVVCIVLFTVIPCESVCFRVVHCLYSVGRLEQLQPIKHFDYSVVSESYSLGGGADLIGVAGQLKDQN